MNLGAIAEVAIGIIFVWIVLSLTTIQIQEWISTRLDRRAKDMEASIHEMLANPNLKAQFYDHPVIRGLTAKKRKKPSEPPRWFYRWPIVRGFTREKRKLPSYIPSQQFAIAMFDIAMTAGTESSVIQQGILQIRDELRDAKNLRKNWKLHQAVIEELNLLAEFARSAAATEAGTAITLRTRDLLKQQAENFITKFKDKYKDLKLDKELEDKLREGIATALKDALDRKKEMDEVISQQRPVESATALSKVRDGIAALSVISPEVHQTLSALLLNFEDYVTDREEGLAKARGSVEKWFNDAMDRVSGAYKRYSQNLALLIGIFVALLLNVDSINLTLYLWREPAVRQALANQASTFELPQGEFQLNPQEAMQEFRDQFVGLSLPIGWGIQESTNGPAYADVNCQMFPKKDQVFGIPVFGSKKCITPPQADDQGNLAVKLLGIFITALAARQGAPFWFDMLKRVVNVRSTGANPAEKEGK
jgi:hypothetical protein